MAIEISGQHVDVTPALKSLIEKKFERIERKFAHITHIHVVLNVEHKQSHKAEVTINISGADIHANADTDDMYATIDALVDKAERQVMKWKEKHDNHH